MTGSVTDGAGAGANTAPALWRAVFGDGEGYLCVASGSRDGERLRDFRERYFRYPEQVGEAADHARDEDEAGRETYFCAHLLAEERRAKDTAAPVRALYADGDGAQVPEDVPEPSVVVESSPGRTQLWWMLSRPVEPGTAERLNRRLARAVGADMSGWDLTQLLRVPGTRNRKYADAPGVSITETTGEMHDPDELDRDLPELPEEHDPDGGNLPEPVSPPLSDEEVLEKARNAGNREKFARLYDEGDTSGHDHDDSRADLGLVGMLAFYTQDPEQLDRLFRGSALMRDKWDEKRGTKTYGERTVHEALTATGDRWQPAGVTAADSTDGTDSARGVTPAAAGPLPPAVPFPVDALPDIPRRLVEEGAASTGTTPDMFAALVLSALGGAVGTSRRLVLKRNWKEYPAVWTCVVSSSGDKKTPAFRIAMAPAYAEQGRLVKVWREGMERHKQELAEWSERKAQAKKDKTEFREPKPEEPELEHVFVQDVTVEELGVILSKTPRGVSALWDELSGFFSSADQYKSGGKGNERQKYLSMWNGGPPLKVDRRGEGFVWAERPLVSVTGTIQPSILPALSRRHAGVVGGDDGMAHRFLFSYPEPPVILSDLTDYDVSPLTDTYYAFLYESLRSLEPDEEGNPVEVRFTEEGETAFRRHNEGFRRRMYLPGVTEAYKSAVAKLASSQLARVSLLLCLVRTAVADGEEEVTEEDVKRAAKIIDYFVAHARRVHAVLFPETGEQRLLRVLTGLVSERGTEEVPGSGVRRLKMSAEDFRLALTEGGVHDAPAANELTKVLLALDEKEPRLEVKKGYLGKGRALDVVLLPPGTPGGTVGSVGTVGGRNAPGEPVSLLNEKGAELVLFVLRRHGPLFPAEIKELTGKTHGAVKKIVSELRTAGEVGDTGKTDEHGSRQVAWVEPSVEGDLWDVGFGGQTVSSDGPQSGAGLDARFLGSHDENEQKGA